MMQRLAFGALGLLAVAGACGPSEDRGPPPHRVYLDDPDEPMTGTGGAAGEGAGGAATEVPPTPPTVTAMMPLSGPYGSEVRIQGQALGSVARGGVSILLGADGAGEIVPTQKPEVISWAENEIRFRFPFPYEGPVVVKTPQGEVMAGEFEPSWVAGPAFESAAKVKATASIAGAGDTIAAVLDTGPPSLVTFDGAEWSSVDVATKNLRADSIRLYLSGTTLAAFALSSATAPEIMELDPVDDFASTTTGLKVTTDYRVAGGVEGATVWWRSANNWLRARPGAGGWTQDKTVADPNPSGASHAAGTSSDGSLVVAWGENTGSTFDDRGSSFHRVLAADEMAFAAKTKTGSDVDDAVSSVTLFDRGSGLVLRYCGTDKDPFGVTGNETLCYMALLPTGAKTTLNESAALRYGFGADAQTVAYCSPNYGLRLVPSLGNGATDPGKMDALAGDTIAWPCPNVVAVEVDPNGQALVILEQNGLLYSPRARAK